MTFDLHEDYDADDLGEPRPAREGDRPYGHRQSEGSYLVGKRDGQRVTVAHFGEVMVRDDGAVAGGEGSVRLEGGFVDGRKEGVWCTSSSNGTTVVENFVGGKWHGEYEAREADGSLLMTAKLVEGEVTELSLPKARSTPSQTEEPEYEPVVGAFGIRFGDIGQLKSLTCRSSSSSCLRFSFSMVAATGRADSLEVSGQSLELNAGAELLTLMGGCGACRLCPWHSTIIGFGKATEVKAPRWEGERRCESISSWS